VCVCVCVCVSVCLSVCLLVPFVSPAKKAELIKMPFGWLTRVGPKNHVLDGVQIPPKKRGQFWGLSRPIEKHCESLSHGVRSKHQ